MCRVKALSHKKSVIIPVTPPTRKTFYSFSIKILFIHENTTYTTRSGVHILVGTPAGKIDIPIMQAQRDISGSMGQIKTRNGSGCMCPFSDRLQIKKLAGIIIYTAKQYQ